MGHTDRKVVRVSLCNHILGSIRCHTLNTSSRCFVLTPTWLFSQKLCSGAVFTLYSRSSHIRERCQLSVSCCIMLHHAASCCIMARASVAELWCINISSIMHCLYHAASCCIMLHHAAMHMLHDAASFCVMLYHAASCCIMLYHAASCQQSASCKG